MTQANNEGAAVSEPRGATSQDVIDAALHSFDVHALDMRNVLDRAKWFCESHRIVTNDPELIAVTRIVERSLVEMRSLVGAMEKVHHIALVESKKQDDAARARFVELLLRMKRIAFEPFFFAEGASRGDAVEQIACIARDAVKEAGE